MNVQKIIRNKKIVIGVIISALVAISALIFALLYINKREKFEILFYSSSGKEVIFSYEDKSYKTFEILEASDDKMQLQIFNRDKEINAVTLWISKDHKVVEEKKLSFDKGKCVIDLKEYQSGSYDVSVGIKGEVGTTYYVSDGSIFEQLACEERVKDQNLVQLKDLQFDNGLEISYPFIWNTGGKLCNITGNLVFSSEEQGEMIITNMTETDICANHVFAHTPLWNYKIDYPFGEFEEEVYYYINATTVNDKHIDISKIEINTQEELDSLLQDGVLQLMSDTNSIVFEGEYDLKNLQINKPVNMELSGNINVSELLYIQFDNKGSISIDTTKNAVSINEKIVFDIPNAEITWEGEDKLAFEYIHQYMNVGSYNGERVNENIGGTGESKLVSATINGVDVMIDGNYVSVESSYTNPIFLDSSVLSTQLSEEGTSEIIENEGDYYLLVTDLSGNKWGYLISQTTPNYTLPVVYITTDSGNDITSKEEYVAAKFSIDYNGKTEYVNVDDAIIKVRGRGNSTWKLDKKPYKIKFESKTSLFGLEESKEWVLLANHVDRTLIRNTVAFETSKILDKFLFVPSSYPVDVFVNGEYQGVYTLGEQIEIKSGRIEIEGDKDSTEVDTNYLIEWGGQGEVTSFGDNRFGTNMHMSIEVKNPDSDILTEEQFNYIANYIIEADEAVEALEGYEEYIDIPSLIDWFLIYEFTYNTDGIFRRSDFFLKKQGDKLYAAAPWDFDYAFGNFYMDIASCEGWICLGNYNTDAYEGKYIKPNWITYLLNDESFKKQLKTRWAEVGEAMYTEALATIDEMQLEMGVSINENFKVWDDCLGQKVQYESWRTASLTTYEEHISYLKDFIEKRYSWMDETINAM